MHSLLLPAEGRGAVVVENACPPGFEVVEMLATAGEWDALVPSSSVAQIAIVLSGRIDAFHTLVTSGELAFTCPGMTTGFRVNEGPAHLLLLRPEPERLRTFEPFFPQPWAEVVLKLSYFDELPMQIIRQLRGLSAAKSLRLEAAVLALIARGSEVQRGAPAAPRSLLVDLAWKWVHEHLDEPIGLGEVAAGLRVSRSRLADVFRRETGLTIGELVRATRVERACRELRTTGWPLNEIALACGFYDQSHLSRAMRETVGLSPAAYRRQSRADGPPTFDDARPRIGRSS